MLTELDPRVLAHLNLHAVLGTLPLLCARVPAARDLLAGVHRPVTVTFTVLKGGPRGSLTFTADGVSSGAAPGGVQVRLVATSPAHFNGVVAGTAQPVPVAGPAGLKFLTGVFTPLSEVLSRYLEPTPEALADPVFRADSTVLTLRTVAAAVAVVANEDRSGRVSAGNTPDGAVDLEVGDDVRFQLRFTDHAASFVDRPTAPPRAALRFADLDVAAGVLAGDLSAFACLGEGTVAMRGMIPMVDNVNRMLDRAGQYLRK